MHRRAAAIVPRVRDVVGGRGVGGALVCAVHALTALAGRHACPHVARIHRPRGRLRVDAHAAAARAEAPLVDNRHRDRAPADAHHPGAPTPRLARLLEACLLSGRRQRPSARSCAARMPPQRPLQLRRERHGHDGVRRALLLPLRSRARRAAARRDPAALLVPMAAAAHVQASGRRGQQVAQAAYGDAPHIGQVCGAPRSARAAGDDSLQPRARHLMARMRRPDLCEEHWQR